ncbi:hypothetical protein I553_7897 [Mycobacterium xenopi 4042]|uniref:Uncharacterized protein n=1 Tax=Mycobacterium xenopi 4042 TaxID=1299334 RepID=X8ARP4_MYCXE|nr:hypothetical protein I553_7897 [Mycobacterium xenopi 4042]
MRLVMFPKCALAVAGSGRGRDRGEFDDRGDKVAVILLQAMRESTSGQPTIPIVAILGQLETPDHLVDVDLETDEEWKEPLIACRFPSQPEAAGDGSAAAAMPRRPSTTASLSRKIRARPGPPR